MEQVVVSGGTASKTFTVSAMISGTGKFRFKNTHGGVADNFSSDLTATATPTLCQFIVTNSAAAGSGAQIIGLMAATTDDAFDLTIAGVQFNTGLEALPYVKTEATAQTAVDAVTRQSVPIAVSLGSDAEAPTDLGVDYGADEITADITITGSEVSIALPAKPYEWSGSDNPVDAEPVLFKSGAFIVGPNADGFWATSGGAISTKKAVANETSSIIVTADGTNHTIRVGGETTVSALSAIMPVTGTADIGHLAGGKQIHAALAVEIWDDKKLSESEQDVIDINNTNILDSAVFQ